MIFAVEDLHIEYGARVLFDSLSFVVEKGERIAFAGQNGAGKSTLMKCVAGVIEPDRGRIIRPKYSDVGYLPQDGIHISGTPLVEEVLSACGQILELQAEIDQLSAQLTEWDSKSEAYMQAIERIGDLELTLQEQGEASLKARVESILRGLGFKDKDFVRDCGEFSGGWQMRIALAKLLLREPDILLLDEPTNHLDIQSQRWVEQYLRQYRGAICIISHDIALLDGLVTRTIAFHHGRAEEYAGNFSFFLRESVARKEVLQRQAKAQEREIAKTERFVERFRAKASKATQAQSRLKQLEKIQRIEIEDDDAIMSFRFPPPPTGGHTVLKMEGVSKSYGPIELLKRYDFLLEKGDRIAIVGVNGSGKSTFTRLISQSEEVDTGQVEWGRHTHLAFFSQTHADVLDDEATILECVEAAASPQTRPLVRNLLGCFLFRGDDVFKKIGVLSGGERSRVALVRMLLHPANFLIMDEPTNHLDFQSQTVLQQALLDYPGSYCIVSHNRQFLDPIVNKVLEFRTGENPRLFYGNVSAYLDSLEQLERKQKASSSASQKSTGTTGSDRKEQKRREAAQRQRRAQMIKPLETELHTVEKRIASCEIERSKISQQLEDPANMSDNHRLMELTQLYQQYQREEEALFSRWDELSTEIEMLSEQIECEL